MTRRTAVALAAALLGAAAQAAPSAPGRYDAQFCVANPAAAPPGCGPMELQVVTPRRLVLRLADVSYRLDLRSSQLALTLVQGRMQLDGFDADYAWEGDALRFADPDKDIAYTVKVGARRR